MRQQKILGGALGDCVHVGGITRVLAEAHDLGYETFFTGPATPIETMLDHIAAFDPDIVGISYRLTPENARGLLAQFKQQVEAAGLANRRFVFGGTPPVAEVARELGFFEAVFDSSDPPEKVVAYLKGAEWRPADPTAYPQTAIERIRWKAPYPLLRHHFGVPAPTIEPTIEGIKRIAEAGVLDVISLGADQVAQEHLFRPAAQDPASAGAGGVPFRTTDDLKRLYEASRRGNYPLMRSYSGTSDHIRYAELLVETINNAWCATSLFWFNAMDGRGPSPMEQSIREHQALMRWHGERDIPVEGNEPYHWGLRDGHDTVVCAASYIYAHNARQHGVRDYIATYMFETPPMLSHRMDLAKALAQAELAESFADEHFRVWRQTRTGLFSHPVDPQAARAHLAQSITVQMAMQPHILHVVSYSEAHHATSAEELIESCVMANRVAATWLRGFPDMTADPLIQERKEELRAETMELIEAIRQLAPDSVEDPLSHPPTLAKAVAIGLLDAPQLVRNRYARGVVRTRSIDGAMVAVDESGKPIREKERIATVLASTR